MHAHDRQERLATGHPGSKRRRPRSARQKRRDKNLLRREVQDAKLATMNQQVTRDEV